MLYQKINIGGEEVTFCTAASVNLCYTNVFHEDYIALLSKEEAGLATSATMQMAFIMAKFGELNNRKAVSKLTADDYGDWLDKFTMGDLMAALPDIQALYMGSAVGTADAKKNSVNPSDN